MNFGVHFELQFRSQSNIQLAVLSDISLTDDHLTYKVLLRFHPSSGRTRAGELCQPANVIVWLAD